MKTVHCKTRKEFFQAAGFDWAKVIKVCGGYIGFSSIAEYKTWVSQK